MRVRWLQHAEFEDLGCIGPWLAQRGHAAGRCALHAGDPLPEPADFDALLVMGGPMNIYQHDRHPWLVPEKALIRAAVDAGKRVLGVCLGAQLLAHAAGARVYPMAERGGGLAAFEVGWAPVRFHRESGDDALSGLPPEAPALHWHGDTFDLPAGARLLASSALCQNQAFRLGRRLFGLQFHCEVEAQHVEAFLRADAGFVVRANGPEGVARLGAETGRWVDLSRSAGDVLLGNILRAMTLR